MWLTAHAFVLDPFAFIPWTFWKTIICHDLNHDTLLLAG
jgi:hypothetical protein